MPRKAAYKDWPEEAKEKSRAKTRAYAKKNPRKFAEYQLKYKYGLTVEEYTSMADSQDNSCAICHGQDTRALSVDHDHATGMVRSLLCTKCNTALGAFNDNIELLSAAIDYIKFHEEKYKND